MKRISGLPLAPPGLASYVGRAARPQTWRNFRRFQGGAARRELTDSLISRQHGLCAYCECPLTDADHGVEHFVSQDEDAALACAHENLMAVCKGGETYKPDIPESTMTTSEIGLPARRLRLSCSAFKGKEAAEKFLDPRLIPTAPSLIATIGTGDLRSAPEACRHHGTDPQVVDNHISGLNLNCQRLKDKREERWQRLLAVSQSVPPEHYEDWIRSNLLPNPEGQLNPFFTTARSFFSPLAEVILATPPQAWI